VSGFTLGLIAAGLALVVASVVLDVALGLTGPARVTGWTAIATLGTAWVLRLRQRRAERRQRERAADGDLEA